METLIQMVMLLAGLGLFGLAAWFACAGVRS